MDEGIRDLLEQASSDLEPARAMKDVRALARRRRDRSRVSASITAVIVAVLGVGSTIAILGSAPGSTPREHASSPGPSAPTTAVPPGDLPPLRTIWSADVPGAFYASDVLSDGQRLYVATDDGVVAYPIDCQDPCAPLWRGIVHELGPNGVAVNREIAVGDGVVAVTDESGLFVFSSGCATDGSVCSPIWSVPIDRSHRVSGPLVTAGVVKVIIGSADSIEMEGYPISCGTPCRPLWTGEMATGPVYVPGVAVDGVFYEQSGDTMSGFAASCRTDGGSCKPDFFFATPGNHGTEQGDMHGPVARDGELIFSSGVGKLFAFPEHCGTSCSPRWHGDVGGFLDGTPVDAGDLVVIDGASGITAFGWGCRDDGGPCRPVWHVDSPKVTVIDHADPERVIASTHHATTSVFLVPTTCGDPCTPSWTIPTAGDPRGVATDGRHVYVGLGSKLLAYPIDCGDPCDAIADADVGGEAWWILPNDLGIAVGASSGFEPQPRFTLTLLAPP